MLKPKVSQQVETSKTKDVLQQVENDTNPLSLESSASVRIIPRVIQDNDQADEVDACLLYTSPSPRDRQKSRMPSSA